MCGSLYSTFTTSSYPYGFYNKRYQLDPTGPMQRVPLSSSESNEIGKKHPISCHCFSTSGFGLYRSLSLCGHLDLTPFQLIVTKLRLDEIKVWCHVNAMNVSIRYCYGNREHDQDGDSVIKVYTYNISGKIFQGKFSTVYT